MAAIKPFDAPLASTLLPSLVRLAQLAVDTSSVGASNGEIGDAAGDTDGAMNPKVEISKQAATLRTKLATLSAQAAALPAGDLSLDDQAWLIGELEKEVERRREELQRTAQLIALSADKGQEAMDTAP
ncbi:vegetative cell wall protein gp1 [Rhodotorula toruloides]|uniref:Vegetative cell wall protein gp1 n=1 Tax=Rhodotorula toruloides TaxID=5286 RepID=A0A511KGZ7_RHOTO|nr:vegetative cell wall protein gp1 [Rhodotorula toruloides]